MSTTLSINEIFFSIQGESTYAGRPCVFVRLAACDLRCVWCDTEYAFYEGHRLSIEEILSEVESFPCRLVEITGGEPLLQEGVYELIEALTETGRKVLIETGGHRDISRVPPDATLIYDIKCPDSGMAENNRWENLPLLRPHDQIKCVIASRRDYDWALARLRETGFVEHPTILFSPVWEVLEPRDLAEWILQDGLAIRMQLQVHKILWGPETRGV